MEVRSLLVCRAVELIVARSTEEDLDVIEKNILDTDNAAATKSRRLRFYVSEFYHVLGQLSGNHVLELHKIEFSGELIAYRKNVLSRLRARDAVGAARAISENLAFLHGFVIARAAEHEG